MFVSRIRAEGGDDRSPWGDFWFSPVDGMTSSGMRVGGDSAMRLTAVYACVRVLTESFAVLPFKLYRKRAGGRGRQLVADHWLYRLFARRPNRFQSPFEFREMLQGHLALRGNAYSAIIDDGTGGVAELLPRHPDRMSIELLDNDSWRFKYTPANGSAAIWYRRDQVWHLRGLSSDGIVGMSPIELEREAIAAGLSAQDYGNRFFANDAKPTGGWIGTPDGVNFADKATRETYRQSVADAISGANRHKMLVLDRGMKYNEVGPTNKDSQFLEFRNYNRSEIAGIFRVPPHMIGDLSRATFSNIEQQSIDFWQNTMLPWVKRWESCIEAHLLAEGEELAVEFDFRQLMRGDATSRSQFLHNMVLDGIFTRNEGREEEGKDPIEGLDEPLVPMNMRTTSDPDAGAEGAEQPPADQGDKGSGADDAADARLAAIVQTNARRMARRVAAGKAPTPDVLASALAIAQPLAQAWLTLNAHGGTEDQLVQSLVELALKGTA